MHKNTDESKMLNVNRPARSTKRSDGTVKIYGHTNSGELMTVVMKPTESRDYSVTEVKIAGKITLSC